MGQDVLESLQKRIGYRFAQPALLAEALTHRSSAHQRSNGRGR
ncbi:MAG: ribonuclease III, partial [Acetobacter sp.]